MCTTGESGKKRHFGRRHWGIGGRLNPVLSSLTVRAPTHVVHLWDFIFAQFQAFFISTVIFNIPSRRWHSQNIWRRSTVENIHLNPGIVENEERNKKFFAEKQTGSLLQRPCQKDSTLDDAEARNDFCAISGNFVYRHHVDARVKLYMPKEESFPIPMKYIDVTTTLTHTSLDVMMEKNIVDHWNVEWTENFRCMDGTHKILFIEWKATWRILMVNSRDWRGNKRLQDLTMYGQICGEAFAWCIETQSKAKGGFSKNTKFDNARRVRGVYFFDPKDEESKDIMKNARVKLDIPMPAAMLCKTSMIDRVKTCRSFERNTRPNMFVLSKLTNLLEFSWKAYRIGIMKITLLEKK